MGFDDGQDVATRRALLKCGVALCCADEDGERRQAPKGDYILTRVDDETFGIQSVAGAGQFMLSVDAVAQHVVEGRMTLDGALPPRTL